MVSIPFKRTGVADTTKATEMMNPPYDAPVTSSINLAQSWHKSVTEVDDHNHNTVAGKLSKTPKQLNSTNP